jgi:hypothetical protein
MGIENSEGYLTVYFLSRKEIQNFGALHKNSPNKRNDALLENQRSDAQHITFRGPTRELLHLLKNK